jgi:hypothetical protein
MTAKGYLTNVGKKEQRHYVNILDKAVTEDRYDVGKRPVDSRTVPKQHRLKGRRGQSK